VRLLMKISPTAAVLLIGVWISIAVAVGSLAPERYSLAAAAGLIGLLYFGWPHLVATALAPPSRDDKTGILTLAWVGAVVANVLAPTLTASAAAAHWLSALVSLGGLACAVALMWTASIRMVAREERSHPRADRCVGTLLLFLFLPLGVAFLQRRIRAIGCADGSPVAAA